MTANCPWCGSEIAETPNRSETAELIRKVVEIADGKQTRAAEMLGVSQPSIGRYIGERSTPIPSVVAKARAIVAAAKADR